LGREWTVEDREIAVKVVLLLARRIWPGSAWLNYFDGI